MPECGDSEQPNCGEKDVWMAELPRTVLESTRVVVLGAVPSAGVGSLEVAAFQLSLLLISTPHLYSCL